MFAQVSPLPDLIGASSVSISSNHAKSPASLRLHVLFAPAPYPLVTYDVKLGSNGAPYLTVSATASCGSVAVHDAHGRLCQGVGYSSGGADAAGGSGGLVPVCVCIGSVMVVLGSSGAPIFELRLGHGQGGATELAAGGDSDLVLMLPSSSGGKRAAGGNVCVMRWVAAVKLRERSLPLQVTLMIMLLLLTITAA